MKCCSGCGDSGRMFKFLDVNDDPVYVCRDWDSKFDRVHWAGHVPAPNATCLNLWLSRDKGPFQATLPPRTSLIN